MRMIRPDAPAAFDFALRLGADCDVLHERRRVREAKLFAQRADALPFLRQCEAPLHGLIFQGFVLGLLVGC